VHIINNILSPSLLEVQECMVLVDSIPRGLKMSNKIENIYCIGRNYAKHAKELGNAVPTSPMVFLKSNSSIRPLSEGVLGFKDPDYNYEAEIVVQISEDLELGQSAGWEVIEDLALAIDLTRRETQNKLKEAGHPWTTAKSFAGSALLGNFVSKNLFENLDSIEFTFSLNGETRQLGNSSDMIFSVPKILNYLLSFTSLKKGDVIFTGTPEGVGKISIGDKFCLKFKEVDSEMNGVL